MNNSTLQIIAACFGATILAITILIFKFYVYLPKKDRALQWHIIFVALSYLLLTSATMITIYRGIYRFGDVWQYFAFAGYATGVVSLWIIFRSIAKKRAIERRKKRLDELEKI